MEKQVLYSEKSGWGLLWLIRITLIIFCYITTEQIFKIVLVPIGGTSLLSFFIKISFFSIALISTLIVAVIWIYNIHKDLEQIIPDYPIRPIDSLKLTLIPIYNIGGTWKIVTVFPSYMNTTDDQLQRDGYKLRKLFFLNLGLAVLGQVISRVTSLEMIDYYSVSTLVIYHSISVLVSIITFIVLYRMVFVVDRYLARQKVISNVFCISIL